MAEKTFVSELFKFAYIPNYEIAIQYLAERLADKEDQWEFSDAPDPRKYTILRNYLEHYFRKINQEGKIVFTPDNQWAAFNTGLVTQNWEEIFALFRKNARCDGPDAPPFFFCGFFRKSDYQFLQHFNARIPVLADFFQKPEDLIFNPNCELIPDIDHIIKDNQERFPAHLQNCASADLRRALEGTIEEVRRKIKTNYKLAVPQFYNGRIQLLLPLCLTPNSPNPDLALAAYKLNENTYTARTILSIKMAYNNARLIVKPQSTWLKP